jgi:hypothetical protein
VLNPPQYSRQLLVDRPRAKVRDRNHFALHRVRESDAVVVESDELNVICLLSFTCGSEIAKTLASESSRELRCFLQGD